MGLDLDLNRVIEAIDKLRGRKNRPNLPGIARYLRRAHNFSADKTILLMETLMTKNRVKEVIYKGNVSFRNMLNWKQPIRPVKKKLDSRISLIVVRTLNELMDIIKVKDRDEEGVPEGRLRAALVDRLDGAVTLDEVRREIRSQLDCGTISTTKSGNLFTVRPNTEEANPDVMEAFSLDSFDVCEPRETTSEPGDELSATVNSLSQDSTRSSFKTSVNSTMDDDLTNDEMDLSATNHNGSITEQKIMENLVKEDTEITCPDTAPRILDYKRRRTIRKKKIYDPSDFELTPLVRRNKRRTPGNILAPPKERAVRGRRRPRGGRVNSTVPRTLDSSFEPLSGNDLDTSQNQSITLSPITIESKSIQKVRRIITLPNDKVCCICLVSACTISKESSISCTLCVNIAHDECVKPKSFYSGSNKWRCDDCKIYNPACCVWCDDISTEVRCLLMCDHCEDFYHADCHDPKIKLPLKNPIWRCSSCPASNKSARTNEKSEEEKNNIKSNIELKNHIIDYNGVVKLNHAVSLKEECSALPDLPDGRPPEMEAKKSLKIIDLTLMDNPNNSKANCEPLIDGPVDLPKQARHRPEEPIPAVDDWTAQQVSDYFCEKFDQDVADAFMSQAIDGKSLKKMSRQDVTNDLGLHLGIALKVLYYVKKIQLGTNLLHQLWA